jgi:hypothetical protein
MDILDRPREVLPWEMQRPSSLFMELLHYEDQLPVTADVSLCIMDMEKNNIVIALPVIIQKYFFLFNESSQLFREEFEDSRHQLTNIVSNIFLPKIISLNDYPMDVKPVR